MLSSAPFATTPGHGHGRRRCQPDQVQSIAGYLLTRKKTAIIASDLASERARLPRQDSR